MQIKEVFFIDLIYIKISRTTTVINIKVRLFFIFRNIIKFLFINLKNQVTDLNIIHDIWMAKQWTYESMHLQLLIYVIYVQK